MAKGCIFFTESSINIGGQELQALQMDMKYRASIEEQKQASETQRKQMDVDARMADAQLRTEVQANDTIIDSETRLEIERMKAQLALILSNMGGNLEKAADIEAVERAI